MECAQKLQSFQTLQVQNKKPLLRQQERFPHNQYEDVYNVYIRRDTYNTHKNIVSSSGSYRKQNARSVLAVIFVPIFVGRRTYNYRKVLQ